MKPPSMVFVVLLAVAGWGTVPAQAPLGRLFFVGGGESPPELLELTPLGASACVFLLTRAQALDSARAVSLDSATGLGFLPGAIVDRHVPRRGQVQMSGSDAEILSATGVLLHLLPSGGVFDPRVGRAELPRP